MVSCRACKEYVSQVLIADLPTLQRWAYLYFSLALLIALASYSFIVPVKQSLFLTRIGTNVEPFAKSLTLVILVPLLVIYSIGVSLIPSSKHLCAVVCGVYTAIYVVITFEVFRAPDAPSPWSIWLLYYATETRSVIIMPMIWSVINDVSNPTMAKKAYPAVFFAVQLGGILGNAMAIQVTALGGQGSLILMQSVIFALIAMLNWRACTLMNMSLSVRTVEDGIALNSVVGSDSRSDALVQEGQPEAEAPPVGTCRKIAQVAGKSAFEGIEGLWLLLSKPYCFAIFWVSYATLMPRTILDYQNSILVVETFPSKDDQVRYWGEIGMVQNCLTAALTLLGTRGIVQLLSVSGSLIVLPITLLLSVLMLCTAYGVWTSAGAVVFASVIAYGLNSPTKEMLYVRTSREIKYKAKGWSEMYGNQLMKVFGSQVNIWVNNEQTSCKPHCFHPGATMTITGAWVVVWIAVALALGVRHRTLEREDKIYS